MRKGVVIIVCRDNNQKNYLYEYICNKLNDNIIRKCKSKYADYTILVNGYQILIKLRYSDMDRGYRPEIVYIDNQADVSLSDYENVIDQKIFLSTRKTPIRAGKLDYLDIIDIQELIDDEYARNNTCDIEWLKK